jgi:hypothetical protein
MTWLWVVGDPIHVTADPLGKPKAFRWTSARYSVTTIIRDWRIDRGWGEERIWRDYFELVTHTGLVVEVYHDLIGEQWFIQVVYD